MFGPTIAVYLARQLRFNPGFYTVVSIFSASTLCVCLSLTQLSDECTHESCHRLTNQPSPNLVLTSFSLLKHYHSFAGSQVRGSAVSREACACVHVPACLSLQ